ncbi:MAG: tetratricopeptide repeat protein [Methanosarcina sp.]
MKSNKEDFDGAADLVAYYSRNNSISSSFLLQMCHFYGSKEMYSLAYIFAKASSRLSTGDLKATAFYNVGVAAFFMGWLGEAEKQYKLVLEIDPFNISAHYNYGILLKHTGRTNEAEEQYKFSLKIDPANINVHLNYGSLLAETGRLEEAEEQFRLALEFSPNNADVHYNY